MDNAQVYATTHEQLLDLGHALDDAKVSAPVPALPGWTVHDAYAHLAGGCTDVLEGRLDGAGSPAWTARQVAERSDRTAPEILADWSERSPRLDAWIRENDDAITIFLAFDIWTHQQDIRAAVGLRGERDDGRVRYLADRALTAFDARFRAADAPPVRIVGVGDERVLGAGEPRVTLRTDEYEVLRILMGRRSLDQINRADWDGDPAPCLDHLHLFDVPVCALAD